VTLDPNGLFYAGSRRLASLFAGAYLEGLPVGFNVGVLVGPGVVLRSCGRRSSDGPLACPGDRHSLRVLLILILIILAREIVFVCEGELLPGPGRAVLVDGLDDNSRTGGGGAALAHQRGLGGPAASAARGLVVVDVGCGTAAPAVCGLVVINVGRVGDGRGGMAAPAARVLVIVDASLVGDGRGTTAPAIRGLVVVDIGRVGDGRGRGGTAAPTARDFVVVDAGVVRLLLVVVDIGRVGDGRGRGGMAAPATRNLVVVDAGVVRLLLEGLGLTSAPDGRDCLRAFDGCLSAPRRFSPRGPPSEYCPRSLARLPHRSKIRSCSRFSSRAPFSSFFSADVAKATAPAAPPTTASI
jgi:hypothetical protein